MVGRLHVIAMIPIFSRIAQLASYYEGREGIDCLCLCVALLTIARAIGDYTIRLICVVYPPTCHKSLVNAGLC